MAIISTNFLVARIAAFLLIFMISGAVMFFAGLFFNFSPVWMAIVGLVTSSFLGSFNVLEPKAIEMEYAKFEKLVEQFHKDHHV